MFEPDFGELQLQQLFNAELITRLPAMGIQPIVPTLHEEHYLGWDTGFYVPGLKLPDPSQKNCNLFLQYKLSVLIEGRRGKQYGYWGQPYFRFNIPHWKSPGHPGRGYPDFHQYDALKNLADNGFATFYVTNHTLDLVELLDWANNRVVIDMNPTLDIAQINGQHLCATFTRESDHYFVDSEPEKTAKNLLDTMEETILKGRGTSLNEDIDIIPGLLMEHEIFKGAYQLMEEQMRPQTIESKWLILHYVIFQTLGLMWWKLSV